MLAYKTFFGQSLWNVVLNTYGSIDFMSKLLIDNNIDSVNYIPKPSDTILWDNTLVADQNVSLLNSNAKVIYATLPIPNGNFLTVVVNENGNLPTTPYYQPPNTNPDDMIKYEETLSAEYTAAGGETSIILSDLIGYHGIVLVNKEIKPLLTSDYTVNVNNGQLTFLNGIVLNQGELIKVIYTVMKFV